MAKCVNMLAQLEMVVLKLFAGPQVGGEAVLAPGEYTLGRDAACDIVIDDILVEPQHCRLIVTEDSFELESLGGNVYVEGNLFDRGPVELFDYIMIGGSCFALGTTKSQWPRRPLPAIHREPVPSVDATPPPAQISSQTDSLSKASDDSHGSLSDSSYLEPSAGVTRMSPVWMSLMAGALFLVVLWTIAANGGPNPQPTKLPEEVQPIEERLWEIARGQTFESDIQIEKSNRGWTVTGYLDTRADRQRLSEELRKVLPSAAIKLWDSETLAESAQGVLTGLHVPLMAKPGKAGAIVIAGVVKTLDQWSSARQRILRDISAIRNLDDQAVTEIAPKSINESARRIAVEEVEPREVPAIVAANVPANSPAEPPVKESQPTPIVRNVYLLPADAEAPPRPNPSIRSVSVGACRSLVTTEGTRVMKGGRLDGWMVMEIAEDKIVLERGKYRHIVDLLAP